MNYTSIMVKKVVIITRTKDRPTFLRRALVSVSQQTYSNYTQVIFNDGGDSDAVDAIIKEQPKDIQEKIITHHRHQPSGAPDTIFNEAISLIESEYFTIHDDDDTWHPQFLDSAVRALDDSSAGAVVARADKVTEYLDGDTIVEKKREHYMPDMQAISLYRQCKDNQLTPIATLVRRSAYEAVDGFDDTLPICGDWDFGIRLLQKYDVEYLDPGFALAFYHHRAYKKDAQGNNSFSGAHSHRVWSNYLMNKYLREELSDGRLGVGYIMSKLRYEESIIATMAKKVLPKKLVESLKNRVRN